MTPASICKNCDREVRNEFPPCPGCSKTLQPVRQTGGYMNSEQFDAVKAGDWYCDVCAPEPGEKRSSVTEYRYFRDAQVFNPNYCNSQYPEACRERRVDWRARAKTAEAENTILRGIASKIMPCHYCGVANLNECPHGFPGCALADDMMSAEADMASEIRGLRAQLAASAGSLEDKVPPAGAFIEGTYDIPKTAAYQAYRAHAVGTCENCKPFELCAEGKNLQQACWEAHVGALEARWQSHVYASCCKECVPTGGYGVCPRGGALRIEYLLAKAAVQGGRNPFAGSVLP